jgi:hypothetical protein
LHSKPNLLFSKMAKDAENESQSFSSARGCIQTHRCRQINRGGGTNIGIPKNVFSISLAVICGYITVITPWNALPPALNSEGTWVLLTDHYVCMTVWTTYSRAEDHSLVKLRQTSISLYQNIIRLSQLRPNKVSPQNCLTHTPTSFYINYILIV